MRHRGGLAVFFTLSAVIFAGGFSIIPIGHRILFIFLLALYALPIAYALTGPVNSTAALIYVLSTPVVPMLLVIDPVEVGLWGHDPYIHSMAALEQIRAGEIQAAIGAGSYPATYILTDSLQTIFGTVETTVPKYLPLISASLPLFLYLAIKRRSNVSDALPVAVIAASTRTLIAFESKFVDEVLAVSLVFVIIFYLPVARTQAQRLNVIVIMAALTLSHHAMAFFFTVAVGIWRISGDILQVGARLPVIGQIIASFTPDDNSVTATLTTVLIMGFFSLIIPLYQGENFIKLVLMSVANALSGQTSSLSGGGVNTSPDGAFAVLSSLLVVSLGMLMVYTLWRMYLTSTSEWELAWTVFVGCLGILYAVSLTVGRAVPLDPIRLLIFIVPLLGAVAIVKLPDYSSRWRAVGAIAVAALLIVPNIAAIPPHLLISDAEKPATAEGHFTGQQWAASMWGKISDAGPMSALEQDLWAATGAEYIANEYGTCESNTFIARNGLQQPSSTDSIFYDNGAVRIWRCS